MSAPDYDVIVVGGGGAGMAAAITAADAGASCMIVEADTKLGGATALSTGVVYAAGTSVQRAAGIEDSAEAMFQYAMTLNQWAMKPALMQALCRGGAPLIDWLTGFGNEFPPDWVVRTGVDGVPRGHQSTGGGLGIAESLDNAAGARGVEIAYGSRVTRLLTEDGRVTGVEVDGTPLRGRATIVTTGGFGNNPAMIERLYPTAAFHGDRTFSVYFDVPYNMGDGIVMAETVGAGVTGIDNGLLNPTPGFGRYVEAFLPAWTMIVNLDGRRFMPETSPYAVSGYLINEQREQRCFAIFDEHALVEGGGDTKAVSHYKVDVSAPSWYESMIRQQVEKGRVVRADSIGELAARTGIDATALQATIARYNADCDAGVDSEYLKQTAIYYPVRTGPFYAVEVRASLIGSTHAGLEIDAQGRVLDRQGSAIPGLFAGGEVLGCTLGRRYLGGGIGIANALIFGRLAGKGAAASLG